ncbi:conserved protein of unknown function [Nitrospira japonica]|uniref:Caspase family p20 domain-containing protein n=2 Tax=Nitrospira japonica TaxID=1325564 RepID=A0A1W1I015_9BACT|nr:conserved protein of unknown function [Nitrospira japonica]
MTPGPSILISSHRTRARWALVLVCLWIVGLSMGCEKLASALRRTPLPDMGPRLNNSVRLTFDPALSNMKSTYKNDCGNLREVYIGTELESVMIDAAAQNFRAVSVAGGITSPTPPDTEILVTVERSSFRLIQDHLYDRVPADLKIDALVTFKDMSGRELGQQPISIDRNQRLILEPTQKRCDYGNIDEFLYESGVALSTEFIRVSRHQLTAAGAVPAAAVASAAKAPEPAPKAGRSPLSFKATVLDENGNLILEGGERVRVRVDLVNGGDQELQQVTATISGTSAIVAQFPATTLSAGRLQPGQSRSLEFAATLPQSVQSQKAEIHVTVSDPSVAAAPEQVLSVAMQPTAANADDVDQVPATAAGFKRPNTFLLSIGIGSYRDTQLPVRKYGASDAEMVATYLQSVGGIPASNVRLLQDWKALRPDIDEALLDWLPAHAGKDAIVIVYFAGVATVSQTGEVYLLPYDGSLSSASRSYPLKDLEAALARVKAKQAIVLFDGTVSRLGSGTDGRGKSSPPQWGAAGGSSIRLVSTGSLGKSIEDEKHRHGLFTYYFLRALRGDADTNRDGEVTLGETASYLSQKVSWASKAQYGQEQRPLVLPPLKPTDPSGTLVLAKPAAITAVEAP